MLPHGHARSRAAKDIDEVSLCGSAILRLEPNDPMACQSCRALSFTGERRRRPFDTAVKFFALEPRAPGMTDVLAGERLEADRPQSGISWPLMAILGVALAVRLWNLESIPPVFFNDECDNTVFAIRILEGQGPGLFGFDWKPQPALAVHIIAGSIWLMGPSVAAVRLPSALLSVAALVPFFLLARRVNGERAALLAVLMLALHPGYLHFSRSGWENVQTCLWTLIAMLAATKAAEERRPILWAASGAAAGIGAMTYFSGRIIPIFLAAY